MSKVQKMTKMQYRVTAVMMLAAFVLGLGGGQALVLGVQHARAVTLSALVLCMAPLVLIRYLGEGLQTIIDGWKNFEDAPAGVKPKLGFAVGGMLFVALLVALMVRPTIISETINNAAQPNRLAGFVASLLVVLYFILNWLFKPAQEVRQRAPKTKGHLLRRRSKKAQRQDVGTDIFADAH